MEIHLVITIGTNPHPLSLASTMVLVHIPGLVGLKISQTS